MNPPAIGVPGPTPPPPDGPLPGVNGSEPLPETGPAAAVSVIEFYQPPLRHPAPNMAPAPVTVIPAPTPIPPQKTNATFLLPPGHLQSSMHNR